MAAQSWCIRLCLQVLANGRRIDSKQNSRDSALETNSFVSLLSAYLLTWNPTFRIKQASLQDSFCHLLRSEPPKRGPLVELWFHQQQRWWEEMLAALKLLGRISWSLIWGGTWLSQSWLHAGHLVPTARCVGTWSFLSGASILRETSSPSAPEGFRACS